VVVKAMIAGNHLVGLIDRERVRVGAYGLNVHERDGVGRGGILDGKINPHGAVRNVDAKIGGVVLILAHAAHHADDLKPDVVPKQPAANSRTSWKKIAHHLKTQHRDVPALLIVGVVQPTSAAHRQIPDLAEVGGNADHLSIARGKVALRANVAARQYRGNI